MAGAFGKARASIFERARAPDWYSRRGRSPAPTHPAASQGMYSTGVHYKVSLEIMQRSLMDHGYGMKGQLGTELAPHASPEAPSAVPSFWVQRAAFARARESQALGEQSATSLEWALTICFSSCKASRFSASSSVLCEILLGIHVKPVRHCTYKT